MTTDKLTPWFQVYFLIVGALLLFALGQVGSILWGFHTGASLQKSVLENVIQIEPIVIKGMSPWILQEDVSGLQGLWVHHRNGSSHPGEEINPGGVNVVLTTVPGPLDSWFDFYAPSPQHMTDETLGGRCYFHSENPPMWVAYCEGFGLPTATSTIHPLAFKTNPKKPHMLMLEVGDMLHVLLNRPLL